VERYRLPQPRLRLGRALVAAGSVHAAMDISDGLLADLGHICETSGLAAEIEWPRLPLSEPAAKLVAAHPPLRERIVAGGDDYELLVTVAADTVPTALSLARQEGVALTAIGRLSAGSGVRIRDAQGNDITIGRTGFRHF